MTERQKMELVPVGDLNGIVYFIRGYYVMLDADIAMLYGYTVKRVNEQARRNIDRFPEDFMFQLTDDEVSSVWSQNAHQAKPDRVKGRPLPSDNVPV